MQLTGDQLFTLLVASLTLVGTLSATVVTQWMAGRRSRAEYWRDRRLTAHMAYLAALRRLATSGGLPEPERTAAHREALALRFESEFFGRGRLDYNAGAMLEAALESAERGRPDSDFWQGYEYYVQLVMRTLGQRPRWHFPWRDRAKLEE